jgi:hypothetical protein
VDPCRAHRLSPQGRIRRSNQPFRPPFVTPGGETTSANEWVCEATHPSGHQQPKQLETVHAGRVADHLLELRQGVDDCAQRSCCCQRVSGSPTNVHPTRRCRRDCGINDVFPTPASPPTKTRRPSPSTASASSSSSFSTYRSRSMSTLPLNAQPVHATRRRDETGQFQHLASTFCRCEGPVSRCERPVSAWARRERAPGLGGPGLHPTALLGSAVLTGGRITRITMLTSSTQAGNSSWNHLCSPAATSSVSATR